MSSRVGRLLRNVADLIDPPPRVSTRAMMTIESPPRADLDPERVQQARDIARQLEDIADAFGNGRRAGVRLHT